MDTTTTQTVLQDIANARQRPSPYVRHDSQEPAVSLAVPPPGEPVKPAKVIGDVPPVKIPSRRQSKAKAKGETTNLVPDTKSVDAMAIWQESAGEVAGGKSKGRVFSIAMGKIRSMLGLAKKDEMIPHEHILALRGAEQVWNKLKVESFHTNGRNLKQTAKPKLAKDVEKSIDDFYEGRTSATDHEYATLAEKIDAGRELLNKARKTLKEILRREMPPVSDLRDEWRNEANKLVKRIDKVCSVLDRLTGKHTPRSKLTGWILDEQEKFQKLANASLAKAEQAKAAEKAKNK